MFFVDLGHFISVDVFRSHSNNFFDVRKRETKNGHNIYEVKSYPESIYTAIGQLLFYKGRLETRYKTNNTNMFIVGNFKIPEKYNKVLKDTSIKYKNIKEFKK